MRNLKAPFKRLPLSSSTFQNFHLKYKIQPLHVNIGMYLSDIEWLLVLIINISQLFLHSLFWSIYGGPRTGTKVLIHLLPRCSSTVAKSIRKQKHFHILILGREKMATETFTHYSLRTWITPMKTCRKFLTSSNLTETKCYFPCTL